MWTRKKGLVANDKLLILNVQHHSGALLSPSALFTLYYTLYALFMVNTCAGRNIFTWHLFNQTVSLHQAFPEPRQSSQFTRLNPMAMWPQSSISDSYLKQRMRHECKKKVRYWETDVNCRGTIGNKIHRMRGRGLLYKNTNHYSASCTCSSEIAFLWKRTCTMCMGR